MDTDRWSLTTPSGRVSIAAEQAGFGALAFTEHPAPSHEWLLGGGHDSLDPLPALAFCAAATTTLRVQTYLFVLPYRNPLLAAKQATPLDRLSGGRLTLGLGSGYLRSEFAALGVNFAERNALFDEGVDAMRAIWAGENVAFTGTHFTALGQTQRPRPAPAAAASALWVGTARSRGAGWPGSVRAGCR